MHSAPPLLLSGRVVLPDGGARQRYLLIRDGVLRWISRNRPPAHFLEGAREIVTGPQDWIFPGLVDLHSHTSYNVLPLWRSVRAPFDNRHVWRRDERYKAEIGGVLRQLIGPDRPRKVFSELQALAGGTTLLDEPFPLDAEAGEGPAVLCRSTGRGADLGLAPGREVRSVVDFFRPGDDGRPQPAPGFDGRPAPLDAYAADRARLQAILVHVAEGRSGFGSYRGVDPYSRAEFEALMAHPAMEDADAVRAAHMAIVHGCGVDVRDPRHLDFLRRRGISIVWSPVSNMLLYDDTIDVEALVEAGVNVALGSDWSPSGSKHVWDEAKFARFFLAAVGSGVGDADVFRMVTTNPGRALGLPELGRIEEGAFADLFILRSPIESDSALEVFFSTTDRDVLATVVGGLPIYGDEAFLGQFGLHLLRLPRREGSAAANKRVHLPESVGIRDLGADLDAVEDQLKALGSYRSNLLADSDLPYRRSIQLLRARAERFGWSARRGRRRPSSAPPGQVPVPPGAALVRFGHRGDVPHADFVARLAATVLPATAALGQRLRLAACFVALPPRDKPAACPDAVLLSFYRPAEDAHHRDYRAMLADSVGGRASQLLQEAAFAHSRVAAPRPYAGDVETDAVYHLAGGEVDWYAGTTRAVLAAPRPGGDAASFESAARALIATLAAGAPGRDAALACLGSGYLALWLHQPDSAPLDAVPLDAVPLEDLRQVADLVLDAVAHPVDAKAALDDRWTGLAPADGDCLKLAFDRLDLFPW